MIREQKLFLRVLALCVLLSGCNAARGTQISAEVGESADTSWKAEEMQLEESLMSPTSMTVIGDVIYFSATPSEGGYGTIYTYDLNSNHCEQFPPGKTSDDAGIYQDVTAVCAENDSLYAVSFRYRQHTDGQYEALGFFLSGYSSSGELQTELDINGAFTDIIDEKAALLDSVWIRQIVSCEEKVFILFEYNRNCYAAVIAENGKIEDINLQEVGTSASLFKMGQEVCMYDAADNKIYVLNQETLTMEVAGTIINTDYSNDGVMPVLLTRDDALFLLTEGGLEQIDMDVGESEIVIDFLDCGLQVNNPVGGVLEGKRLVLLDSDDSGQVRVRSVEQTNRNGKSVELTLGTLYLTSAMQDAVRTFNQEQTGYHIKVVDYSEYNRDGNSTLGATQLALDILDGNAPDLIDLTDIPGELASNIREFGLLRDLEPFFQEDPDVSLKDYFPNLVELLRAEDGTLYEIAPSFTLLSVAAHTEDVEDLGDMTWEEIYTAYENSAATAPITGGSAVIIDSLAFDLNRYYNPEKNLCHFDTEEFHRFIEFAGGAYSEPEDFESFRDKRDMLCYVELAGFASVVPTFAELGNNWEFTGYPGQNSGASALILSTRLAISKASSNQEPAWIFLKYVLENSEEVDYFPANREQFVELLNQAALESGDSEGTAEVNGYLISLISKETGAQLLNLAENADFIWQYDSAPMAVIQEEILAYADGAETPEAVSVNIQSRLQAMLGEQN